MKKIGLLIPYFGKWPEWIDLFIDSVERNSTIDFHFLTDCDTSVSNGPNIHFHSMTFADYVKNAEEKIGIPINVPNPYKICDLRPMFGLIHYELIKNYDLFGWTDVDLLFGDIRSFYTNELLKNYEVFSTHSTRISGHLALIKNTEENRNKYLSIYKWQEALQNPRFVGIDEHGLTNAFTMTLFDKVNEKFKLNINNPITRYFKNKKLRKLYMKEQYTTPFLSLKWLDGSLNSAQPTTWFYHQGKVTNDRDQKSFIYIHFMNFKSSQWRHDGTKAPWEGENSIYHLSKTSLNSIVRIDLNGINLNE
ncbi:MAG: hypothetical protein RL308_1505 [Bacteroidota bacterium]|jgi:hypothetical protein